MEDLMKKSFVLLGVLLICGIAITQDVYANQITSVSQFSFEVLPPGSFPAEGTADKTLLPSTGEAANKDILFIGTSLVLTVGALVLFKNMRRHNAKKKNF